MNWSLYGWYLLTIEILGVFAAALTEPYRLTLRERVLYRVLRLAIYMPLVGHLLGWW